METQNIGTFRGRKIYVKGNRNYPCVYWPDHPVAYSCGSAYIHRIVAYEKYGEAVISDDTHVHHVDEDIMNWDSNNLLLMNQSAHSSLHSAGERITRKCKTCGTSIHGTRTRWKERKNVFCSSECTVTPTKIEWPDVNAVVHMIKTTNFASVGRSLGVSCNAVRKYLRKNSIDPKTL